MRYVLLTAAFTCLISARAIAQQPETEPWLRDRGAGLPTSMFGTFIQKGELIYPFFEAYVDDNFEYKPEELGASADVDYRGRYRAKEGLVLIAYGLTDRLLALIPRTARDAKITAHQREQTLTVVRDLEVARLQGQRWRAEARTLLKGLGDAIDEQFKLWNFTEAKREVRCCC